jgi:hypothetical protein
MSNPKEKAKELFNKMYNCELDISYYAAKQCALIAVDEILIEIRKIFDILTEVNIIEIYKYWEKVKNEIEKL